MNSTKIRTIIQKLPNILFYIALTLELIIMIIEKSEISLHYESYIFRITFVITLVSVLLAKHNKKEWGIILFTWILTFYCYKVTGRNDLLRITTFVMAAREINLNKVMKYILVVSAIGFALIAIASLLGLCGDIYLVDDYGRGNSNELRYTFGFGHPNTFFSSFYSLLLLWIWNYAKKAKWWYFVLISVFIVLIYVTSASRTSLIISALTLIAAVIFKYFDSIKSKTCTYVIAASITPGLCLILSTYFAGISHIIPYLWEKDWRRIIDNILTNRISYLYSCNDRHPGSVQTWELFSTPEYSDYFDLGFVRLFYWYGIIPTFLIALIIILVIYQCQKESDIWTVLLIVSLGMYTIIEATYVSKYIGRNMLLPIMGVYISKIINKTKESS